MRLIRDEEQLGIVPLAEAQSMAEQASLDLVEIAPGADPQTKRVYVPGQGTVEATVATGQPARPTAPQEYRVVRGDTLVSIARRFGCGTKDLAKTNGIEPPRYQIRPGQRLKLDGCSGQ